MVDLKCHICGAEIVCNDKDGCRESPTRHVHYQVTWGNPKTYGGWADITLCGGHTSQEINEWLQRKVDASDLTSDREKANAKEAEEIMAELRANIEEINRFLNNKNFQKWYRKLRKPKSLLSKESSNKVNK